MTDQAAHRRVAVALKYDAPGAPKVVASGAGLTGDKIIAVAQAHGVPMTYNPPLAQALSTLELETEIPERLYVAVAEVLSFLLTAAEPD
ncbi:MAG TPA: EscU/YscU/HrcU family type III secretion system export apparatus switch protein [Phenylobacterium sp.]|nr:EscU/YscU/HrcU family type III secretion system export apparatus switch protein [Phenylobacterium sp.]HQN51097.1 EscU/YscU/HrcU family type III secretion system export apparatus switch protein [Phenylobacterium sp.]HQP21089.1 EscU/YscU/HrcU family type III secretion system export apparatus switch protein [Phenylobacterium sp.]